MPSLGTLHMRFMLITKTILLSTALIITACGGGGSSSTPSSTATPTPLPGIERPTNTSCIPPTPDVESGSVILVDAFPSLPIVAESMKMVQPLNDGSFWFLTTRSGIVYSFSNDESASELTEVLDLSEKLASTDNSEYGFTGFAVHPNYPADNRIFALYNDGDNSARATISSFSVNTTTKVIDPNSEQAILTLDQNSRYHNGGDMSFGPDGFLYAAFGDDQQRSEAQLTTSLYGTIIRIDIDSTPYAIPNSNPFDTGQALCDSSANSAGQTCPEVYAYGLRNPWRFSIDTQTGSPWIGDVGESDLEEIDRIIAGGNYGWPIMEGDQCLGGGTCDTTGLELPITVYDHDTGVSVAGGYVYRGTQSPSLSGQYIYGDIFSNRYFSLPADSSPGASGTEIFDSLSASYGMAQGNDGEVYVLRVFSYTGTGGIINRVAADNDATVYTMADNLSDTGCFNVGSKTSTDGVFDFDNINPLWSDGAVKLRAFAIPDDADITVLSDGEFRFPDNTVLMKHFLNDSTYLETRLLVKHPTGWQGYSYEWNDAQTEATLLTDGKTKDVGDFVHTYPSPGQCSICHIGNDASLGIETLQLNRGYAPLDMNILTHLTTANYFSSPLDTSNLARLYALDDDSATLEQRARSYLHSNCSGCHRPDTSNRVNIDFRYSTALADTNTCGVDASLDDLGVTGAQRIFPGNADASVALLRMATLNTDDRMPPLASLSVDSEAVQLIRDWINGLENCE